MLNEQGGQSLNINTLQETAMNVVENFCGVVCRPVDMILRPWHGTQYYPVPVIFFSTVMMVLLPIFAMVATTALSMLPLVHIHPPMGLFDIGSLAKLYFLLSMIHGVRLYRRMLNMPSENISVFEGPPLPFFPLLPKGNNFWFCRIVLEPVFVMVSAMLLGNFYIITPGLALFLELTAVSLAMKNYISWFRGWKYIRDLMDMRYMGPIIAKLAENQATDEELNSVHLASFPKNIPPEMRQAAASHMARPYSPEQPPTNTSDKEAL